MTPLWTNKFRGHSNMLV